VTETLNQKRRVGAFLEIGRRELAAAEALPLDHPNQGMFFLQQSAEKLARALIEADGKVAGPTHNIRTRVDILTSAHPLFDALVAVQDPRASATRYRYPSSTGRLFDVDDDPQEAHAKAKGCLEPSPLI
jgi:HEPN domain-containing protein